MNTKDRQGQLLMIGFLQVSIEWEQTQVNLDRYAQLIEQANTSFQLIVLPEMFHCGFTMQPQRVAQTMDGDVVQWMKRMAVAHRTAIMGSVVVHDEGRYFNRLICVAADGEMSCYDKRHLFRMGGEDRVYTAGNQQLIVNIEGVRIKPLICYDLRFPVWSRNRNDYDLLIFVANWPSVRQDAWDLLLRARAVENQCYVLGVNRIGSDGKLAYTGGSVLVGPKGDVVVGGKSDNDIVYRAEIDLGALDDFRRKFPAYLDADRFDIFS